MAHIYNTTIHIEYQGFYCEKFEKDEKGRNIFRFLSNRKSSNEVCPYCGSKVSGNGIRKVRLIDVPLMPGEATVYEVHQHRYRCWDCGKTYTEENPFKVKGYQLTKRCVEWIFQLLRYRMTTSDIAKMIGIHWNTVRKLEKMRMEFAINQWNGIRKHRNQRTDHIILQLTSLRSAKDTVMPPVLWIWYAEISFGSEKAELSRISDSFSMHIQRQIIFPV